MKLGFPESSQLGHAGHVILEEVSEDGVNSFFIMIPASEIKFYSNKFK